MNSSATDFRSVCIVLDDDDVCILIYGAKANGGQRASGALRLCFLNLNSISHASSTWTPLSTLFVICII